MLGQFLCFYDVSWCPKISFSFDKHVFIMFCWFLVLILVSISMFRSVFSKHVIHNILNSINCKMYLWNVGKEPQFVPKRGVDKHYEYLMYELTTIDYNETFIIKSKTSYS